MSWSMQDDDGLEGLPGSGAPRSGTSPSSASGAFPRASVTRESHESVVVDPVSQIPAPLSSKKPSRRAAEPTLVLRERQLDQLRAEVRRRQSAFRLRRFSSVVLWIVAGAFAVAGGAFLARNWDSKASTAQAERAAVPSIAAVQSAPAAAAARVDSVAVTPVAAAPIAAPSVEPAAPNGALDTTPLASSPSASDLGGRAAASRAPGATEAARPTAAPVPSSKALPSSLSLDDLPTE